MDLNNPSYFTMMEDQFRGKSFFSPRSSHLKMKRSFSCNSGEQNHELFVMGEPRLADIAPEIVASRTNSLNNKMMESFEEVQENSDEVFVSEDAARYYNCPAARFKPRRHSISTFVRDRTSSKSSIKEALPGIIHATSDGNAVTPAPVIDDHSLRHASYPRKRCTQCNKGTLPRSPNMDDILILSLTSSDPAALWVEYFSNYFLQISKQAGRKPFKIQFLGLEDLIGNKIDLKLLIENSSGVKLQLAVICPSFLQFLADNPEECQVLSKILHSDRIIALLLGVNDGDITEAHRKILPSYQNWQRQHVGQDQDEHFTKEFLAQAMGILSKIWKQQTSVLAQDKTSFSVTPKKIRQGQGQNSVFILLNYPLQKEDLVKVSLERNGSMFEVKSSKRRNPYTIKIVIPENLTEVTAIVNILVEKNGNIIGSRPIKCESKVRELEQILRSCNNPIEFMCQALEFAPVDKEKMDNWLVQGFQRNLPPHFHLLANHNTPYTASVQLRKHVNEEFPTLLHFAAKFGFVKLAIQLLDCPGSDVAYEIRNVFNSTPLEIAEANGHQDLANILKGYMNMNDFASAYAKIKEISQVAKSPDVDEEGYLKPNAIDEFYKICPSPKPVMSPVTTPTSECNIGYMSMKTPEMLPKLKQEHKLSKSDLSKPKQNFGLKKSCIEVIEDKTQRELAEIILDCKNNVHTISEAEALVQEWKSRNEVQKSFQEKQEQLFQMRKKYEEIQKELKKPTTMERIFKMFMKKREDKSEISSPVDSLNPAHRPISSLSTSSSGSSGRMSTISGSSVGDSGTHSDSEERKNVLLGSHSEDDFRNQLNKAISELDYTPVPIPKPVKMTTFGKCPFETIQEKPASRPDTLPVTEQYYIQFPPSGMPVNSLNEKDKQNNEYMNVSANQTEPVHDYMNFKSPTV